MIFRPELARLVRKAKKTQTRRVAQIGKRRYYEVGRSYAIQESRGGKSTGRIRIVHIDKQPLTGINHDEAIAEGFKGRADFALYWLRLHGFGLGWRCALDDRDDELPAMAQADKMIIERFVEQHGHVNVWVYTFRLDDDPPEFLARRGHTSMKPVDQVVTSDARSARGYTLSASEALEPVEPVDDKTLADITSGAMERRRIVRAEEEQKRVVRTLAERLKEQTAQSRRRGVDVSPMLERIREELDRMQDELGRAA